MNKKPGFLKNSLIIAAHPDDEVLWFGSILKQVDEVVVAFEDFWPDPTIGPARAAALATFPRGNISSLRLPEAATYGCADWKKPTLTEFGIALGREADKRDLKQKALRLARKSRAPVAGIRGAYEQNHGLLVEALRPKLSPEMNVFTHNPWGEYGHEDHIQLFRAIDQLRSEIGFKLWMSNYCTERSLPLAMHYFGYRADGYIQLPVDQDFAEEVADCYRAAGCWTWTDEWVWFETECFMEAPAAPSAPSAQHHLYPFNFFYMGS